MKKPAAVTEEKGECAPLWIISFADMISLLMAFFIMLLTMSTARSGKLCNEGQGIFEETLYGFRRTVAGFGIPGLFGGQNEALYFRNDKAYYPVKDGDSTSTERTIDAREEKTRRIFNRLSRLAKTYKSQVRGQQPNFVVVPITFAQGQFALDEPAKQFLNKFTADLQQAGTAEGLKLYVVGLASQEVNEKKQWIISAKRAAEVANFVKGTLPAESKFAVYSWGAGAGGDWAGQDSPISKQSQVLIAVLKAKN